VILAPAIEIIPLTGLAGLLIVVGFGMIKLGRMNTVWNTGVVPSVIMIITFTATLFLDLQVAVAVGVILTFFVYVYQSAEAVRLERIVRTEDGSFEEGAVPETLPSDEVVGLQPVGSLFFAGMAEFEEHLPETGDARNSVVIIRLRDRDEVGSTFIRAIKRYTVELTSSGNKLMLVGLSEKVILQLEKTGLLDVIGEENVLPAQRKYGASTNEAWTAAELWIASRSLENR
jgi:SulP family sulfate permease